MSHPTERSSRREFVTRAAAGVSVAVLGPGMWGSALLDGRIAALVDRPIFGPLGPPDSLGLRLPAGFRARLIARAGDPVATTGHVWHQSPDGGGVVARETGGWIYASNSEVSGGRGGVSCVSFSRDGEIDGAYSILTGTTSNCAGGMTPWGTWLSCEEFADGRVYECDPFRSGVGVVRPLLGQFSHEAAAVDAARGPVYLTEDEAEGRLYRFTPDVPGVLTSGQFHAASVSVQPSSMRVGDVAQVQWVPTATDRPDRSTSTSAFAGGEGAWVDGDRLLFTTKRDVRVWALGLVDATLRVLHDSMATPATPLDAVDNIVGHPVSGDLFVAEDGGNMQLCVMREFSDGALAVEACVQIMGQNGSEVTGPAFSPDGTRLYLSSQRGVDGRGLTYEISGPFSTKESISVGPLRPAKRVGTTVTV